ncbi:GNAT family N-acetyltransferase [Roseomonas marmotae]|uniref:N-acetyltransferase family protein n=1 Tax=Roseomonas marmotae TaxID=2768161 RepID=A0ABS3KEW3_9PROT|nr:GNAT family N-acetyltransferase [Roseomonas marmotae]MBO1075983.1 N-acetyltransferase family protein [Roseomonas marmotae]QTI80117.1 N-acetyltransferase family protein [Roseomonas marmotae]
MILRDATADDLPAIVAIYAHHVLTGTGTFEETPPDQDEMARRLARVQDSGWAWLVAEDEGEVKGYGYFAALRDRSAYRFSAEDSIYVRDDVRGQGVGKSLVAALVARAEAAGFRQMFAVIGDSENVGSIGLHLSLGFRQVGLLRSAGLKFGRWLDVVYMQRPLGAGDRTLP